ncbi:MULTISPECIES: hypothetical protein [unclassified Bradyrhizobium]|uniref:hypothetical protein n=1 Tax=unclassified Bradyrhizobium TaxID=2631580 RepID=UPI002916C762|nr:MULTISPECIES: hypothetical protein [unclassified Bradyrhizobium]
MTTYRKGEAMNPTTSLSAEESNARNELSLDRTAAAEQLDPDFALVQLDTTFITLLSEISALESHRVDERDPPDAENVRSDDASRTQKIESVLARLAPIELAIMATPARTIVGLGIKARHAAHVVSEHWDVPIEQMEWDARVVRLLIEAICKIADVRLPFPNDAYGASLECQRTPNL